MFTVRYLAVRRTRQFIKSAASAEGAITNVEQTTVTAHRVPVWITTIGFQTDMGQQIAVKLYDDSSQGVAGDMVKVLYLSGSPRDAKLNNKSLWSDGTFELIFGIVWSVFAVVFGSVIVWAMMHSYSVPVKH